MGSGNGSDGGEGNATRDGADDAGSTVRRLPRDRDEQGRPVNARPRDEFGRPLPRGARPERTIERHVFSDPEDALAAGVRLWDEQRFFEAHEVLEDVWNAAPEEDRLFWQGIIQVAVGCTHHQRGNAVGCAALLRKAAAKLAQYPDVHHGVDVEELRVFALGAADVVELAGVVEIGYPEFPALDDGPTFRCDPRELLPGTGA